MSDTNARQCQALSGSGGVLVLVHVVELVPVDGMVEETDEARVGGDDVVRELVREAAALLVGLRLVEVVVERLADLLDLRELVRGRGAASWCCGNSSSSPASNQMN